MRSDSGERKGGAHKILIPRVVGIVLISYGAVGVVILLRLLPLLATSLASWSGLPDAADTPARWGALSALEAHFDSLPWLPLAAWLLGLAVLSQQAYTSKSHETKPSTSLRNHFIIWLVASLAILLILVGGYARMAELWPQSKGISQFPYDDEGVYAGTSQLFLQGILPYKDYFFAHPPLAAISYMPAMAYHFTAWGSPTSFMMARYLSVAYSLVTLVLIFFIGWRLANLWGGVIAGGLWALDGRVIEINRKVMLDGPMVLLSCAALLLYLWVRPSLAGEINMLGPKKPLLVLILTGVLAAMSALTKIAGVACLLAILVDLLWLYFDNRRAGTSPLPLRLQLASLFAGAFAAFLLCVGPFLVAAPSRFIREVIFFQLLRPSDGLIDIPARIGDLSATLGNSLTVLFAALGFISISLWFSLNYSSNVSRFTSHVSRITPPWRAIVLWTFFSLLLFTYTRSFYSHYYIQLAAPLCLLGAGVGTLPELARSLFKVGIRDQGSGIGDRIYFLRWESTVPLALLLVVALPLVLVEWNGANSRHEDRIFEIVGRYVSDAVPPGTQVLATDEQFDFLAARPPSHSATGYLIDSYGHMIFLGLGLNTRDWGDLVGSALRGEHSNDAYAIMQRPAPQADFLDRAMNAPLVVLHQKGMVRLTQNTIATIEAHSQVSERQARYTIYRVRKQQ